MSDESTVQITFNCPVELRRKVDHLADKYKDQYTVDEIMAKLLNRAFMINDPLKYKSGEELLKECCFHLHERHTIEIYEDLSYERITYARYNDEEHLYPCDTITFEVAQNSIEIYSDSISRFSKVFLDSDEIYAILIRAKELGYFDFSFL